MSPSSGRTRPTIGPESRRVGSMSRYSAGNNGQNPHPEERSHVRPSSGMKMRCAGESRGGQSSGPASPPSPFVVWNWRDRVRLAGGSAIVATPPPEAQDQLVTLVTLTAGPPFCCCCRKFSRRRIRSTRGRTGQMTCNTLTWRAPTRMRPGQQTQASNVVLVW
jgi:hypothetical protein